jgi:hypothetical protein
MPVVATLTAARAYSALTGLPASGTDKRFDDLESSSGADIRRLAGLGYPVADIAADYGIDLPVVYRLLEVKQTPDPGS